MKSEKNENNLKKSKNPNEMLIYQSILMLSQGEKL
jgi:hypothetical protein